MREQSAQVFQYFGARAVVQATLEHVEELARAPWTILMLQHQYKAEQAGKNLLTNAARCSAVGHIKNNADSKDWLDALLERVLISFSTRLTDPVLARSLRNDMSQTVFIS